MSTREAGLIEFRLDRDPGASQEITSLFEQYRQALQRYAAQLARDGDSADDLVQETFLCAAAHLDTLRSLNAYQRRAWLYQVLKNRFLDQVRAARRRQAMLERLAAQEIAFAPPAAEFALSDWLSQVPERFRNVLEKRYLLGMTSEAIAKETGVPAATIRSRLRLALQWLRARLPELEE
jgi:RNA polymerase sigma-70 factor, ECF subfamily